MRLTQLHSRGVHIKLTAETHKYFRMRLLEQGVTMQDAFEEFARLVGGGNASMNWVIDRLVQQQLQKELNSMGLDRAVKKKRRGYQSTRLRELDDNVLYDMINEGGTREGTG